MKGPKLALKNIRKLAGEFLRDESGQSTTEYVLLLLFVVVAVKAVGGQLRGRLEKILNAAFDKTDSAIQDAQTN